MRTVSPSGNGQWTEGEPQVRRFLFDTSFDDETEEQVEPVSETPEPPPPSFTLEELERARSEGFAAGHREALAAASQDLSASTDRALERIAAEMAEIEVRQQAANEAVQAQSLRIAVTIMRKLMPRLAERHGGNEVIAFVGEFLGQTAVRPKVTVRVAAAMVSEITQHLQDSGVMNASEGRLVVEADETLGPADCSIGWENGGAERSAERIWQEIDMAVDRFLADGASVEPQANAAGPAPETAERPEGVTAAPRSDEPGDAFHNRRDPAPTPDGQPDQAT